MSRPQKRYSREYKIEVVRRIQESGRTQAEVAKELGIATNTVSRWVRQYRSEKAEAFPGKGSQTSQSALISRLRRENERLRKERDFLKKLLQIQLVNATRYALGRLLGGSCYATARPPRPN